MSEAAREMTFDEMAPDTLEKAEQWITNVTDGHLPSMEATFAVVTSLRMCVRRAQKEILVLRAAQDSNESNEKVWTPCSVKLPEAEPGRKYPRSEDVLVTVAYESGEPDERYVDEAFYDHAQSYWEGSADESGSNLRAVAWMPKPEPYRG